MSFKDINYVAYSASLQTELQDGHPCKPRKGMQKALRAYLLLSKAAILDAVLHIVFPLPLDDEVKDHFIATTLQSGTPKSIAQL